MNCGKVHNYLGMTLDYTIVGQVKIIILDYIKEILGTFDKEDTIGGSTKSSDAPAVLFKANIEHGEINAKHAVEFHLIVANTLFDTKQARPDTCTKI